MEGLIRYDAFRHGLFQSVRPSEWKLSLLADIAHTTFYEECPVIDFVTGVCDYNRKRCLD